MWPARVIGLADPRQHQRQPHRLKQIVAAASVGRVGAERDPQAGLLCLEQWHDAAAQHQVAGGIMHNDNAMCRQEVAFGRGEPDPVRDRQPFPEQTSPRHLGDQPT